MCYTIDYMGETRDNIEFIQQPTEMSEQSYELKTKEAKPEDESAEIEKGGAR